MTKDETDKSEMQQLHVGVYYYLFEETLHKITSSYWHIFLINVNLIIAVSITTNFLGISIDVLHKIDW